MASFLGFLGFFGYFGFLIFFTRNTLRFLEMVFSDVLH